jgi:hypothetical protein
MSKKDKMSDMNKLSNIGKVSHPGTPSSKIRRKDILCYIMKVSEEYQKFAQLQR